MSKLKRISINHLEVGMVLGDDVINSNGLILIPRNTTIHQKHIIRLKLYDIYSVVIKETLPLPQNKEPIDAIEKKNKFFSEFSNVYQEKEEVIKEHLHKIGNGESVKIDELLNISTPLLKNLKSKSTLFSYMYHLQSTDDHTYTHSINVSLLCNIFGNWLKLNPQQIEELTIAGLLHDIGKTKIDPNILNKPTKLTDTEFNIIKMHSKIGYDIIKDQNLPESVKLGVLMHHEKIDGSGYPLKLKDSDIHYYAKIISITDIYDAMTSNRAYHKKFSPFKVIQVFETESYGLLDTALLFTFLENIAHNYLGEEVKLSNGKKGTVVFINSNNPSKPIISTDEGMIDLHTEPNLTIEEIL